MYLLSKIIFHYPSKEKDIMFSGWKKCHFAIFPDNTRTIMLRHNFFEKAFFSEHLKKISYFHVFFFWEKSFFTFLLKNKIIWSLRGCWNSPLEKPHGQVAAVCALALVKIGILELYITRNIWTLSDSDWSRTHSHLVRKGIHLLLLNK